MGIRLFLALITEAKGDKKNLRSTNKLKRLELTDMMGDILVCDFEVKRNLYNECKIEIRKSVNDIHSFNCSEDQILAEILEFDADLKIIDITLKCKR